MLGTIIFIVIIASVVFAIVLYQSNRRQEEIQFLLRKKLDRIEQELAAQKKHIVRLSKARAAAPPTASKDLASSQDQAQAPEPEKEPEPQAESVDEAPAEKPESEPAAEPEPEEKTSEATTEEQAPSGIEFPSTVEFPPTTEQPTSNADAPAQPRPWYYEQDTPEPQPQQPSPSHQQQPEQPAWTSATPARKKKPEELTVFDRGWNWFIFGKEYLEETDSREHLIASHWLLRAAVIILIVGIGFFVQYAMQMGYLGPIARMWLVTGVGVGLFVTGASLLRKTIRLVGQGLVATGAATLYFAAYGSAELHHLIDIEIGFACMCGVSFAMVGLSILHRSRLIAVLAAFGAYLTPVMLQVPSDTPLTLCIYLTILATTFGSLRFYLRWIFMNGLAMGGTYVLLVGKISQLPHYGTTEFWLSFPFMCLFFLAFQLPAIAHAVRYKRENPIFEGVGILANTTMFVVLGIWAIKECYPSDTAGYLTAALAIYYLIQSIFLTAAVETPKDKRNDLADFSRVLALIFAAWTVPVLLDGNWVTVSWTLLGTASIWYARRLSNEVLAMLGGLVLALSIGRLIFYDYNREYIAAFNLDAPLMKDYIIDAAARLALFIIPAVSLIYVGWLARKTMDTFVVLCTAGAALLLLVGTSETYLGLGYFIPKLQAGGVTVFWAAYALVLIAIGIARDIKPIRLVALLFFVVVVFKIFLVDLAHLEQIYRIVAFIALGLVTFAAAFVYINTQKSKQAMLEGEEVQEKEIASEKKEEDVKDVEEEESVSDPNEEENENL